MVRRSFAFALADKVSVVLMSILTMAIVSRILTPAEVGLFLVASTIVILIEAFRDFGIGTFLIREPDLAPRLVRTAVTIITCMSLVLGGLALFGAETLAQFYADPKLAGLIRIAALAFLVAPISTPLLALLRRDMAFGAVAAINVAAGFANASMTIGLALAGYGPFSLVWGSVLAACVTAMGAVICRPLWWIFVPTLRDWRLVVPFGAWSSIVTLLGMLFDAFPRLILGRVLGFGAVGLFARAISLSQLPDRLILSAVQPVLLPALASHARDNGTLKAPFLMGLSYISGLQWPALAMIAVLADPIVRLLLGPQWLEVVPLVRIVALAFFCLFPVYLCYPVLVTLGRVRDMAVAMMIALPPCFLIMLGASRFGVHVMALSLFLTGPIQVITVMIFVRRKVPFAWAELGLVLLRSGGVTLVTVALPAVIVLAVGSWNALSGLSTVLAIIGAAIGWVAGLQMMRHPLSQELGAARSFLRAKVPLIWGVRQP
ncbi:oligosaccharide flippase family protein [uncultured Thioclava sp.]|uniref:oligosaccharide flippase family protein n=1 Tax=uncultured Thioclava sp. TaxID=473858 RepID=UPI0025EC50EC|nr:oligosaccharide flippase family protein [uncultured Thioclava sp.]